MYKIDHKNLRAKIKNLEQRLDFQRYNIREKQKDKGRKKEKKKERKRIINKQTNKQTNKQSKKKAINNHPKTVYGVCLKKKKKKEKKSF